MPQAINPHRSPIVLGRRLAAIRRKFPKGPVCRKCDAVTMNAGHVCDRCLTEAERWRERMQEF